MNPEREAALAAIYSLRRAKDEATNGPTANPRFIDQEVAVALGELERAFLPDAVTGREQPLKEARTC